MDLEPGQPVFVKEVNGNIWRTATVDQPAAEPDSYWVRFPDNSILRRTRSMIKPRSSPSHFELQAEAQQRNFEGETNSCSFESFNQLNGQSMLPVAPMVSVTKPATIDRDTPAYCERSHLQPSLHLIQSSFYTTKTFNEIHQRCSSSSLYPIQEVNGLQWMFCVCKSAVESVGLIVFSVLQYRPVKHELCGIFLTFSVFQIFTLVTFNSSLVWQINNLISSKGG